MAGGLKARMCKMCFKKVTHILYFYQICFSILLSDHSIFIVV